MRNALNTDGTRMLSRMEWLTKLQILGFFSRLSAKRKQSDGKETSAVDDDEELFEEYASLTDEQMLEKASVAVESEIGVKHLVMSTTSAKWHLKTDDAQGNVQAY